ncbi:tRNA (guanine-N-7) methyltransferase [Zea mays]|uniref:tRNA (guanine(46)-N(7))-methyltransferase n=2 Tax=Zea mays TaxID=4577 RepID=A0A1D6GCG1_MAIZE|nr:tRNA (guanine-N-7) methyltransferase [Zea mays]
MAWTAAGTVCWRLLRLPSVRCPLSSRARCSAAQSLDAVDKEYADLNLRPLYPNVCRHPSSLRPYPRCYSNLTTDSSMYAEGPSHAHTVAREPAQLILLGAHGAARVEGGVRRPLASPHGRHRLREWEVLDLAREEFWQESKLPWARNPPKGFIGFRPLKYFGIKDISLVERAQFWVNELELMYVYFMFANATMSFEKIISSYPGPLSLVSILCPDPHFKKRHHKRRVLQQPLVDSIINNLCLGGQVFIQSDVLEVAVDMRERFDGYSGILAHVNYVDQDLQCDNEGWLLDNPMGIRTEREIHAELEGATIYRRVYQKVRDASF